MKSGDIISGDDDSNASERRWIFIRDLIDFRFDLYVHLNCCLSAEVFCVRNELCICSGDDLI